MKNFLFSLIIAILFFNIAHAKSYKTGDIVVDEFIVTKKYKVDIPGEWKVIYRRSDSRY